MGLIPTLVTAALGWSLAFAWAVWAIRKLHRGEDW
jgi:hypothetical protein